MACNSRWCLHLISLYYVYALVKVEQKWSPLLCWYLSISLYCTGQVWPPPPDSLFNRRIVSTETTQHRQRGPREEISCEAEKGETSRWATKIDEHNLIVKSTYYYYCMCHTVCVTVHVCNWPYLCILLQLNQMRGSCRRRLRGGRKAPQVWTSGCPQPTVTLRTRTLSSRWRAGTKGTEQLKQTRTSMTALSPILQPPRGMLNIFHKEFLCIHMCDDDDDEKILVTLKLKCVYFPMTDLHKRWKVEGVIKTQRHQRYVCELLQINTIWKTCMQDILDDITYFNSTKTVWPVQHYILSPGA